MAAAFDDKAPAGPHKLVLDGRKSLTVSGVDQVVSFDENAVVLQTRGGGLLVRGQNLQLKTLSQDGGQVAVEGQIDLMAYEEPRAQGSFLRRLLGT